MPVAVQTEASSWLLSARRAEASRCWVWGSLSVQLPGVLQRAALQQGHA
jgi:hypothetical protein